MIISLQPEQAVSLWHTLKDGIKKASFHFTSKSSKVVATTILEKIVIGDIKVWVETTSGDEPKFTGFALTNLYIDSITLEKIVYIYLVYAFDQLDKEVVSRFIETIRKYSKNVEADRISFLSYRFKVMDKYLEDMEYIVKVGSLYEISNLNGED